MVSQGLDKSLHNLPSEGAQDLEHSKSRGAVEDVLGLHCSALLRLPILSHFQRIFHGPSCPGLQSSMQSVKRSSQSLKPLLSISYGSALESGYSAGLIIAFLCLSTPREPINIGTNIGDVSELMILLFSVSGVAVGVVFVLFNHSYAAGLDEVGFDVACMQIKPHA